MSPAGSEKKTKKKKQNRPDIASFVCYALLHVAVFVGFSCVWKEAFCEANIVG